MSPEETVVGSVISCEKECLQNQRPTQRVDVSVYKTRLARTTREYNRLCEILEQIAKAKDEITRLCVDVNAEIAALESMVEGYELR